MSNDEKTVAGIAASENEDSNRRHSDVVQPLDGQPAHLPHHFLDWHEINERALSTLSSR